MMITSAVSSRAFWAFPLTPLSAFTAADPVTAACSPSLVRTACRMACTAAVSVLVWLEAAR